MKLESINIRVPHSYEHLGKGYVGEITFNGPLGKVQINADDALSKRILHVCADEIVAASRQVAEHMTADIIEQVSAPALEAPAE